MATANEWLHKGDEYLKAGDERKAQACFKAAAKCLFDAGERDGAIHAGLRAVDSLLRVSETKGAMAWVAAETLQHIENACQPWQRDRVTEAAHDAIRAAWDAIDNAKAAWYERYDEKTPTITENELWQMTDAVGGALVAGSYVDIDLGLKGRSPVRAAAVESV